MENITHPYAVYDTYESTGASQDIATALMGPCFVGWMIHLILYGIVVSHGFQYIYTTNYQTDRRWTKATFWALLVFETLATVFSFGEGFHYGTNQERNTDTLLLGTSYLDSVPFGLIGTVAAITQAGLAKRASKFFVNRRSLRTVFIVITGTLIVGSWLASLGVTILNGLYASGEPGATAFTILSFNDFLASWSFCSAGVDLIITASLCLVLSRELRGFNRVTDNVLKTVIILAMQTGALTSFFALAAAIIGVAFSSDNMHTANITVAFIFPLSSLYTLSYLVTLSTRGAHLRPQTPGPFHSSTIASGFESNLDFGRVTKAIRVVVHNQEILFSPAIGKESPKTEAASPLPV